MKKNPQTSSQTTSHYDALPDVFTPEEVAKHFGWSPRKLRDLARQLGACRILGNRMVFLQKDVDAILEATRVEASPKREAALLTSNYQQLLALREKQAKRRP